MQWLAASDSLHSIKLTESSTYMGGPCFTHMNCFPWTGLHDIRLYGHSPACTSGSVQ